ncbi:hypothetical protein [Nocardioides nanhaiensis]|uniref:Lipoprotein n=1 Tax=Nocardioides nanhaiensis TaxID=1476871 RepID=A0ABP8VRH0_9ACTN
MSTRRLPATPHPLPDSLTPTPAKAPTMLGSTPRTPRNHRARRTSSLLLAGAVLASGLLSGCSSVGDALGLSGDAAPSAAATAPVAATEEVLPYESVFTRDGTFQSHTKVEGLDMVLTLYPTKATPRTHEWYPAGDKYFSFTFQAYDLRRELRDDFDTKREVYAGRVRVTSTLVDADGPVQGGKQPYELDDQARDVTFDPEPLANRYGMLITSPKGALELRNQAIGSVPQGTVGIDLKFSILTWIETAPGSDEFERKVVKRTVPISVFASETPTVAEKIPYTSN